MYQNQLIAAISLLFLAHAVSGLPYHGHHRHGGHHRFLHHPHSTIPTPTPLVSPGQGNSPESPHAQQGTPATPAAPKIPATVPTPATPRIPATVPTPATPQIPVPVSPPATPQAHVTVPTPAIPGIPVPVSPLATPQANVTVPTPAIPGIPVPVSPPVTPQAHVTVPPPAIPRIPVPVSPPATPQTPVRVPPPVIPRVPVAVSPPATPQTPVTVPAQPPPPSLADGISGEISENEKKFGWDPWEVMKGCGANCDLLKYLRKEEFLIAHNWVRLLFKLPLFTWDEKLESAAKQNAMDHYDDCKMAPSDFPYGENHFWGLKLHWTPSDAVYYWYNESIWYNFNNLQCTAPPGHDCAHFTQLVWKDSVRLGCVLQHCRDSNKGMLIVCEYDPPGNYDNENPLADNNAKWRRT